MLLYKVLFNENFWTNNSHPGTFNINHKFFTFLHHVSIPINFIIKQILINNLPKSESNHKFNHRISRILCFCYYISYNDIYN